MGAEAVGAAADPLMCKHLVDEALPWAGSSPGASVLATADTNDSPASRLQCLGKKTSVETPPAQPKLQPAKNKLL